MIEIKEADVAGTMPPQGPRNAVPHTPERAPGSVRRTMSIDISRPDGPSGAVLADARGRDAYTDWSGRLSVLGCFEVRIEIDPTSGTVSSIRDAVSGESLERLVGVNVNSGYGRSFGEQYPEQRAARPLQFSVLEDLNGAVLVSGYSLLRNGVLTPSPEYATSVAEKLADVCAGWATGAPLLETMRGTGMSPLPFGPAAPDLVGDDAVGWHGMAPLEHGTVRRRRRIDLVPGAEGSAAGSPGAGSRSSGLIDSHFRDSYAGVDEEMVMHEYTVEVDLDGGRARAIRVEPRVLPWRECPAAVASAQRVVGAGIADLPGLVQADFVGASTCTHLNSSLRCLADAPALAGWTGA